MGFSDVISEYLGRKQPILSPFPEGGRVKPRPLSIPQFLRGLSIPSFSAFLEKAIPPATVSETIRRPAQEQAAQEYAPTPAPKPEPKIQQKTETLSARTPTREDYEEIIKRGFGHWGDVPAKEWAGTFAQAPELYPIYQKHPYLPAAVSILESGAGKNITYPNNPMNWGIRIPSFQPKSPEEAIMKMITGVGGRMGVYEPFRQSGELADFANTYAPPSENATEKYINDLGLVFDVFRKAEEDYFNERQ